MPILDEKIRKRICYMFDCMMADDEKGRLLTAQGDYFVRTKAGSDTLSSQELFYQEAYDCKVEDGGE